MFGENLKNARKKCKLTQSELGNLVGVTGAYIQQLEKGIKTNPSLEVIVKICDALNVLPSQIASGDKDISEALSRYYSDKYAEDIQNREINDSKQYERLYDKISYTLEEFEFYSPEYEEQTDGYFAEITITDKDEEDVVTVDQSKYVELGEKMLSDIEKYREMRVLYFLKELKGEE